MLYIAYGKIKLNSQPIFKIYYYYFCFYYDHYYNHHFKFKFERKPIHFNINDLYMGENNVEIYKIEKRKNHENNSKKR